MSRRGLVMLDLGNTAVLASFAAARAGIPERCTLNLDAVTHVAASLVDKDLTHTQFVGVYAEGVSWQAPADTHGQWRLLTRAHRETRSGERKEMHCDEAITTMLVEAAIRHRAAWESGDVACGLTVVLLSGDRDMLPAIKCCLKHGCEVHVLAWRDGLGSAVLELEADSSYGGRFQVHLLDPFARVLFGLQPVPPSPFTNTAAPPCKPHSTLALDALQAPRSLAVIHNSYFVGNAKTFLAQHNGLKPLPERGDPRLSVRWEALAEVMKGNAEESWAGIVVHAESLREQIVFNMKRNGFTFQLHPRSTTGVYKEISCAMSVSIVEHALVAAFGGVSMDGCRVQILHGSGEMCEAAKMAAGAGAQVEVFCWRGVESTKLNSHASRVVYLAENILCTRTDSRHSEVNKPTAVALYGTDRDTVDRILLGQGRLPFVYFSQVTHDWEGRECVAVEVPFVPSECLHTATGAVLKLAAAAHISGRRWNDDHGDAESDSDRRSTTSVDTSPEREPSPQHGFRLFGSSRKSVSKRCMHRFHCRSGHRCTFAHTDDERLYFARVPPTLRVHHKTELCSETSKCSKGCAGCNKAHGQTDSKCTKCGRWGHVNLHCVYL